MKTVIYLKNRKIITEIKTPIKVEALISDIKTQIEFNTNSIFHLFDNNQKLLKETDLITPNNKDPNYIQKLYLIESPTNIEQKSNEGDLLINEKLEKVIMKVTDAKSVMKQNKDSRENLRRLDNNDDPFNRLFNLLQVLEDSQLIINNIGIRSIHGREISNGEVNEDYVKQLHDMGFPEDRARQALINSRNNLNRATEILLGESE